MECTRSAVDEELIFYSPSSYIPTSAINNIPNAITYQRSENHAGFIQNWLLWDGQHLYKSGNTRASHKSNPAWRLDQVTFINSWKVFSPNRYLNMARWFRSEPMEYISLIVNEDAAHSCLGDLGKMGVIQFTDVSFALADSTTSSCNGGHKSC